MIRNGARPRVLIDKLTDLCVFSFGDSGRCFSIVCCLSTGNAPDKIQPDWLVDMKNTDIALNVLRSRRVTNHNTLAQRSYHRRSRVTRMQRLNGKFHSVISRAVLNHISDLETTTN